MNHKYKIYIKKCVILMTVFITCICCLILTAEAEQRTMKIENTWPFFVSEISNKTAENEWTSRDYATVIGPSLGIFGTIVAIITILVGQRNNRLAVIQKSNRDEIEDIDKILEKFYGPFLQISNINGLLYGEFRLKHVVEDDFVMLTALLDTSWRESLDNTDKSVLAEIVENGKHLEGLIRDKAGLVEPLIMPYLARASTHFKLIQLASAGSLSPDKERISRYRYPSQLDHVLEAEVKRLQKRRENLRMNPSIIAAEIPPLIITPELELQPWPIRPILQKRESSSMQ